MARPSRAERRRLTARDAAVSTPKRSTPVDAAVIATSDSTEPVVVEASRTLRTTRRMVRVPEQIDYTAEYAMIGHDLRRIALWGILMIAIMIGIRYSGLV